jgi:hypothetical protein
LILTLPRLYLPKNLFYDFNVLCKLFGTNQVFLEMAVPIILSGIAKTNNESLQASYFWNGEQTNIQKDYNQIKHVSHPFKLSQYNTYDMRLLMCQNFVTDKFHHF